MKRVMKYVLPVLLIALLIGSAVWYMFVYDRSTVQDFLSLQARNCVRNGHFDAATWFYNLSYKMSDQDQNVAIELADIYRSAGNYTKAEATLTNAIADGGTAELYIALCQTFMEQDKILDAVTMLDSIADPSVREEIKKIRPATPTVDTEPGLYSDYITLQFTATEGDLYITTNGEYPSTQDTPSDGSVTLEGGETKIYALAIGDNGLVSPVSIFSYTVGGVIEDVQLQDPAVDAAVREVLLFGEDTVLTTSDLWSITQFTVPENAQHLWDLSYMIHLEELTITNQDIPDFSFLAGMKDLKSLTIQNCSISADNFYMKHLSQLTSLTFSGCGLSATGELAPLVNLTYLDLSNNAIGNISVLENMSHLQYLDLSNNAVSTLVSVSGMTDLATLNVSGNSVESLSPLSSCTALTSLNVSENGLDALTSVDNLTGLTEFYASHNALTAAEELSSCTELEIVDLSHNFISHLNGLTGLDKIRELDFSYNQVSAVPDLGSGNALARISADYNQLVDISALSSSSQLNDVFMDYNSELEDISVLHDCENLTQVNVYGTKVSNAEATKLIDRNVIVNFAPTQDE